MRAKGTKLEKEKWKVSRGVVLGACTEAEGKAKRE